MAWRWAVVAMLASGAPAPPLVTELVVRPGEPVDATVAGQPARLLVGSGRINRLTLDEDFVAAHAIKPAAIMGKADLTVAGRREFKGHNRSLTLIVAGRVKDARAFWFAGAPDSNADGAVGPLGLPQERVTFVLGPTVAGEQVSRAPFSGTIDTPSYAGFRVGDGGMGVTFDVEDREKWPVASAAAGALIARTFGGSLSGPSWDVEVLMGVKRPVRLLTLDRPMTVGPFSFSRVAVRVRDRIDASGRGHEIADADAAPPDPSEIVVEGIAKKGPRPIYTLSIPRALMGGCSRISFDRAAKVIEFMCRPAG